jgi:hypothetical protein
MVTPICWDGVPPSTPRHTTQVFTVPKGSTVFVRFLDNVQGVGLHWLPNLGPRGRSLPTSTKNAPTAPIDTSDGKATPPPNAGSPTDRPARANGNNSSPWRF